MGRLVEWDGEAGSKGFGDGVHAVEGAGEDEVVVCGEVCGAGEAECAGGGWRDFGGGRGERCWVAGGEGAVVDEGAGFGDYEEGKDGHGGSEEGRWGEVRG